MHHSNDSRSPLLVLYLAAGLIPLLVGWWTWSEHSRRVQVMTEGLVLVGEVTASGVESHGRLSACELDYAFSLDGMYTPATAYSCRLMRRHPAGGEVQVRVDPKDPQGAMIVGESAWPIYWPAVPILVAIWVWLGWTAFRPAADNDRRRLRRK